MSGIAEQFEHTILTEDGFTLAPCNDCGRLTFYENELCETCWRELDAKERWEAMNPQVFCPPRE